MSVKYIVLRSNGVTTEVVSTVQREDNSDETLISPPSGNQKLLILSEASSRVREVASHKSNNNLTVLSESSAQNGDLFPAVFFANSSGEVPQEDLLFDSTNIGAQIVTTGTPPQQTLDEQIMAAAAEYSDVKPTPPSKKAGVKSQHKCDVCFRVFPSSSNLKRHYRTHTGEKPFQCKVCSKAYAQIDHLKRHLGVHSDENTFKCEVCGKSYKEKTRYIVHMRTHTGERPFSCGLCGKGFTSKVGLMKHRKVHTGERKYECAYCLKRFTESQTLRVHERIHTGERPYVCKFCGKGFSVKKGLRIHIRTHTGERPYSCDTCWRKFISKSALNTHKKSHMSVFPFSCKFCGKTFPLKGALRVHVQSHLREKNFECSVCFQRFARKNYLDQHMKLHTELTCGECGVTVQSLDVFEAHVKSHELSGSSATCPVVVDEPSVDNCDNLIGNALDTLARATQVVEETRVCDVSEGNEEFPDRENSFLVMEVLEKYKPRKRERRNSV